MIALVLSIFSVIFAWQQTRFTSDSLALSRKALAIDRKLQICLDFIATAEEFENSFGRPRNWSWPDVQNSGVINPNQLELSIVELKLGVQVGDTGSSKLFRISRQAKLLLNSDLAKEMDSYAEHARKSELESLARAVTKADQKMIEKSPNIPFLEGWTNPLNEQDGAALNSLREVSNSLQKRCGDLVERDAS